MLGARVAGFGLAPDYALVMDVTHAKVPEAEEYTLSPMGSGISVCASAVTNRRLTRMSQEVLRAQKIPFMVDVCATGTGTNANVLGLAGEGIPTVLWSLPIKSMHSAAEVLFMDDAKALAQGVRAFVRSKEIAAGFGK